MEQFDDQVVVITGGASGIGLAMAEAFAAEGGHIVIADIEASALDRAASSLPDDTVTLCTDVTNADDVERLAQHALEHFGRVDIVCNNAGISTFNLLEQQTLADWKWVLDVDLWGVVHGIRTFLPILRRQGTPSHIVNTASAAGLMGAVPFMAPYAAAKAGVIALTETLKAEIDLAQLPIGVTLLCPGFTNTRVLEGARNRPRELGREQRTEQSEGFVAFIRENFSSPMGKEPRQVAEEVLAAIRSNQFWLVTGEGMAPALAQRWEVMLGTLR